jgi:hypothetical protein
MRIQPIRRRRQIDGHLIEQQRDCTSLGNEPRRGSSPVSTDRVAT